MCVGPPCHSLLPTQHGQTWTKIGKWAKLDKNRQKTENKRQGMGNNGQKLGKMDKTWSNMDKNWENWA